MASTLLIGLSTRAIFNLEHENEIYEKKGIENYISYQIQHEKEILQPGIVFNLVKNFQKLSEREELKDTKIEFILLSRSCPDISVRIFNSIEHYNLPITRGIFTGGKSIVPYIKSLGVDLYLSANRNEVELVKKEGYAAALVNNTRNYDNREIDGEVYIAFDGDCVLFGSESEDIFRQHGIEAFEQNEKEKRHIPIEPGTFKNLLVKLSEIQSKFDYDGCPLRIALCTARGAVCSQRVINTFRYWNLRVNAAFFLNGTNKAKALAGFNADIFFDDSISNIKKASEAVPSCLVL